MDVVGLFLRVSLLSFHFHSFSEALLITGICPPHLPQFGTYMVLLSHSFQMSRNPRTFPPGRTKPCRPNALKSVQPKKPLHEMGDFPATPNELSKQQQAQGDTKGLIQVRSKTPLGSKKFTYGHITSIQPLSMLYTII